MYSSLVLQHLPPALARSYLAELARVLRPGGAMAVQVATRPTVSVKGALFRYAPQPLLGSASSASSGTRRRCGYAMSTNDFQQAIGRYDGRLLDTVEDTYAGHWVYHRHFARRAERDAG